MFKQGGFTFFELLVGIAIAGILVAIGLPNLTTFNAKLRVDDEVSTLNRLLLAARNAAVNNGKNVTVCPLTSGNKCDSNWQNKITVFIDTNANKVYESATDTIIKVKQAVKSGDKLQFSADSLTYTPEGRLLANGNNTFKICPLNNADLARGIVVSTIGRTYKTSDTDNDGKDEDRNNAEIVCS